MVRILVLPPTPVKNKNGHTSSDKDVAQFSCLAPRGPGYSRAFTKESLTLTTNPSRSFAESSGPGLNLTPVV
jgi:hypothetical protein